MSTLNLPILKEPTDPDPPVRRPGTLDGERTRPGAVSLRV
ncbi:hypothetical protein FTUN_7240 [Frigoriglobus tundricola]|uniref:Uncharacterized protein n=1 Tax=Frigoriglobus tundricola TaxID=2774151 RepID=A0A6M5Z339_9BACT|nr:hypothetical protein FTUN_7240 [Frigoriglobus tundricola]